LNGIAALREGSEMTAQPRLATRDVAASSFPQRPPRYSIVVPFHNEEQNAQALYDRLIEVMTPTGETFELVFVDDGSTDQTFRVLNEISAGDARVTVVRLRRNYGQTSGLAAGFDHAQGEYIVAMGGAMQLRHFYEATGRAPHSVSRVRASKYSNVLADGRSS
jgi:cellulose synthase/poly-beta-1,6-N-acetylglucosamine synthase-like glycosyltransferase